MVRMRAKIVRGSAYPEQTKDEILSIQGPFESWFSNCLGIGPIKANSTLWSISQAQEDAINNFMPDIHDHAKSLEAFWLKAKKKSPKQRSEKERWVLRALKNKKTAHTFGLFQHLNKIAPEVLPVSLNNLSSIEPLPTTQDWEGIINLIGLTIVNRKTMSDPVEVRQRPLFVLPDNRVILVDISNALDVLWDKFEQAGKNDERFFQMKYQRKKAKWLEERSAKCLSKIFPSRHIYKNATYPDPDKSDNATAELDVAVEWGPFLVLVEVKAKQFRMESQLGNVNRLRTDVKQNVEDAFEQARRAAKYIAEASLPVFTERSSGRKLTVQKKTIRRIYLITISQHHLSGLATDLAMLQDLGFFKDGDYPFSISIGDFEIISEFCDGPDTFLHYIERRLAIQKESIEIHADELNFFGAYLDTRLQASRIWETEGKDFSLVSLMGFSDQFDTWMMYRRGELSVPPTIKLKVPEEIQEFLAELRNRNDDGARWVAFALLDMSDANLEVIAKLLKDVRGAKLTPGMLRRYTHQDGDTVISIVASQDHPASILRKSTAFRAMLEKYRRKAFKSIGIGIKITDLSRPFDCVAWFNGPWEYNQEMEKSLSSEPAFVPAPGEKLPGRNAPCVCGSGKKFKKCCLPKIEAARRKGLK